MFLNFQYLHNDVMKCFSHIMQNYCTMKCFSYLMQNCCTLLLIEQCSKSTVSAKVSFKTQYPS